MVNFNNEGKITKYMHHGDKPVAVFTEKKGQHRGHCLCFQCQKLKSGLDDNCEIAKKVYETCKEHNIVSPVWECPEFTQKLKSTTKRPLIICFVGESGSGKSRASRYIRSEYGIKLIQSYTEREKREEELEMEKNGIELDHTFITKKEFDQIDPQDMIAYTDFGEYRYCCTKQDVEEVNLYIIDEFGLKLLRKNFVGIYDIVAVRFNCDEDERVKRGGVTKARLERDKGKFNMRPNEFNFIVDTNFSLGSSKNQVDYIMKRVLGNHTNINLDLIDLNTEY